MGGYRAFLAEDSNNYQYELTYYHNPNRWRNNIINTENPIRNVDNWSDEIKYLNESNDDLSDDIKNLPNDTGGIYVFYIKGLNLSFIENYILYIGRCQFTETQHIRKRAREYYKDTRDLIVEMFSRWKEHLYYRYYPDTNNEITDVIGELTNNGTYYFEKQEDGTYVPTNSKTYQVNNSLGEAG